MLPAGCVVESVADAERESGPEANQSGNLPSSDQRIERAAGLRAEALAVAEWQTHHEVAVEAVPHVEIRERPVRPRIERILNQSDERAVVAADVTVFGGRLVVDRFRPNVAGGENRGPHVLVHGYLQAVVIRVAPVRPSSERRELRIEENVALP